MFVDPRLPLEGNIVATDNEKCPTSVSTLNFMTVMHHPGTQNTLCLPILLGVNTSMRSI